MDPTTLLAYLGVIAVVLLPPDGNAVLVAGAYAGGGLRGAFAFIAGDLSANLVQLSVAATVLGALLTAAPTLIEVLRWTGVGVLVLLAAVQLRNGSRRHGAGDAPDTKRLWALGLVSSAVNPTAVVFFAAMLPTFVDAERPVLGQLILLAVGWIVIDGSVLLAYAVAGGQALSWLTRQRSRAPRYAKAAGLLLAAGLMALIDPT